MMCCDRTEVFVTGSLNVTENSSSVPDLRTTKPPLLAIGMVSAKSNVAIISSESNFQPRLYVTPAGHWTVPQFKSHWPACLGGDMRAHSFATGIHRSFGQRDFCLLETG